MCSLPIRIGRRQKHDPISDTHIAETPSGIDLQLLVLSSPMQNFFGMDYYGNAALNVELA